MLVVSFFDGRDLPEVVEREIGAADGRYDVCAS